MTHIPIHLTITHSLKSRQIKAIVGKSWVKIVPEELLGKKCT